MTGISGKRWLSGGHGIGAVVLLLAALVASATPPQPPVSLQLGTAGQSGSLNGASGKILLSLSVGALPEDKVSVATLAVAQEREPAAFKSARRATFKREFAARELQQQTRVEVPVEIDGPGHYEIDLSLRGRSNSGGFSDRLIRHVIVDADGSYRVLDGRQWTTLQRERREQRFREALTKDPTRPDRRLLNPVTAPVPTDIAARVTPSDVPAERQTGVRGTGPSPRQRQYSVDASSRAWAPEDPITVRGRLLFQDFDGTVRPLVNVSVNLWDDDVGLDEHLGSTVTDWSGNWSFSVNNDDGWGANGRDIYYSFKLENSRWRVQDCDGIDSTYEWESGSRDDLDDGVVVDFGSQTGSGSPKPMQIWNHFNQAWNHVSGTGAQDPGFVDSCFPYDATRWDRFWEEVDIEEQYNDGPDVVTHEYGHAVMYYAYDEESPSPGGSHNFDQCSQDPGLSWSEGWGTALALSLRPDGAFNWHQGDGGRAIEAFRSSCRTGERNEGWVAAALTDMLDSADDTNGGSENGGRNAHGDSNNGQRVPLSAMLRDTLWGSYHTDMLDFWYSLAGELNAPQSVGAREIMYYDWMSVPEPTSCVASRIVTVDTPERDTTLANLRTFRDKALKPFPGGRQLINLYYRNSPEIALILLKDKQLRERALTLVQYFARVGDALDQHAATERLFGRGEAVVPREVAQQARDLIAALGKGASAELARDLDSVAGALSSVEGRSLDDLAARVAQTKSDRAGTRGGSLQQSAHTPASREALKSEELRKALERR
ncbi:MAG: hypothetical protein JNN30_02880 [Rhodanobacteraceae bacterium]|nr:hypothetical protein [Rhodanobacteraceae bacterium]